MRRARNALATAVPEQLCPGFERARLSQAAEKGLKVGILAVFSSFSYSQVVDSWFERMGKLLTWFLFQRPV
jgi:hypothetical protein